MPEKTINAVHPLINVLSFDTIAEFNEGYMTPYVELQFYRGRGSKNLTAVRFRYDDFINAVRDIKVQMQERLYKAQRLSEQFDEAVDRR